jgi:predicted RNA-binding protein with PIN domain
MGTHIVIDGYNLIRQCPGLFRGTIADEREALLDFLAAYKKVRAHSITAVFDAAAQDLLMARSETVKGIRVRYSGPGGSADSVIKEMARELGERALVVSSDRDVSGGARASGAAVMDSVAFYSLVMERVYGGPGGPDGDDGPDRSGTRKKGPSKKPSKKERKTRQRIGKL